MCSDEASAVQSPWLRIVGLGADGWDSLGPRARERVASAALLVGGSRHLAAVPQFDGQQRMAWPSPLHDALDSLLAWRGTPVCVLATGDPFWYGVGVTLARHVDPREMEVVPHPSAFALAAARMGWALQDTDCVSVHGRALERVIPSLHDGARVLVLTWDGTTAAALARLLCARGFGRSRLTVLERMGAPDEDRVAAAAVAWEQPCTADLNTVAIDCVADAEATTIASVAGRPDDLFDHEGQITKREIRTVTLALLAPGRGECLWDVGAGSGAIGIEWMLSHARNHAVAVEADATRAARVVANAKHCGVPELECVEGRAPAALAGLATPDAVFIGGGLTTPELLATCWAALRPGGRLVVNSVTVEGDAMLARAMAEHGGSLRRLAVSRAEPLGGFQGWAPLRPVTIWCATRPVGA